MDDNTIHGDEIQAQLPAGAVKLQVCGILEQPIGGGNDTKEATSMKRETAVFHWREGATAAFIYNALRKHGARMLHSNNHSSSSTDCCDAANTVELFASAENTVPLTIKEIQQKIIAHEFNSVVVRLSRNVPHVVQSTDSNPTQSTDSKQVVPQILVTTCSASTGTAGARCQGLNVRKIDPEDEEAFVNRGSKLVKSFAGFAPSFGVGGSSQVTFAALMAANKHPVSSKVSRAELTWEEVARHNKTTDCWVVLHGEVFDVTRYLDFHPGGKAILLKYGGQDITAKFNHYHPWVNARHILAANCLGPIQHACSTLRNPTKSLTPALPVTAEEEFQDCIEDAESS